MRIAVDFDGTIVKQEHAYDDLQTPLELRDGAREGLAALRQAGHILLLWSGRASRALREDPQLDPLVRAGAVRVDEGRWRTMRPIHEARYQQMLAFVAVELPDVFHAIDDGLGGKPLVDLIIDDKGQRYGAGGASMGWPGIARMWGEEAPPPEGAIGGEFEDAPVTVVERAPSAAAAAPAPGKLGYQALLEGFHRHAAEADDVQLEEIAGTSVGPIVALELQASAPLVILTAGQHGEEQAGPLSLYQHMGSLFARARQVGVALRIYPCVNPEGFERVERRNARNESRSNGLMEFEIEPGKWVGELPPGIAGYQALRVPTLMARETRALYQDLEVQATPVVALDLHQDSICPAGTAFAYVFGDRAPYAKMMRASKCEPLALRQLENKSWTDAEPQLLTDADGLVEFWDGSVTNYFWMRGALLAACLETCIKPEDAERAVAINVAWCMQMIDYAAGLL